MVFQSGMFNSCHPAHSSNEFLPALPLRAKHFSPLRSEAVVAPSSLFGLFHPTAIDQATVLQAVEQRIKGGDVKSQNAARPDLDEPGDVIAVARLILQQGQRQ